jgi:hypothetical protein
MRAGIASVANDWVGLEALVEWRNRDRNTDKVFVGEDGKCAGNVAEVGETEWRAKEGTCTGQVGSSSRIICRCRHVLCSVITTPPHLIPYTVHPRFKR